MDLPTSGALYRAGRPGGNNKWNIAHLRGDYVPDAYLQQVLTSAQLDRIVPLSGERWQVEDLGHDRHLVTARDTTPWLDLDPAPYTRTDTYATRTPAPDPDTLTRADFHDALLTWQLAQDHPSPGPT